MADTKPTQLPPDYEDRHRLAHALCQHLGINPQHVALDSLRIELGPDQRHRITWTGHAHLNLDDLTRLLLQANHPNDNPDPNCDATTPALYGQPHPGVDHRCHLPNGHHLNHQCGICATLWEPNRA